MLNYFYCENPYRKDPGGATGYLSLLYDGMNRLGSFRSASGIEHGFLFSPVPGAYQPAPQIREMGMYPFLDSYSPTTNNMDFINFEMERHFYSVIPPEQSMRVRLSRLASIHAHGPYCFLPVCNFLRICGIEGDVIKILTPHNPVKTTYEEQELVKGLVAEKNMKDFMALHEYRDEQAFARADALVFPCEESLDGYYATWLGFKDIVKSKRLYFAPTGVAERPVVIPGKTIRKQYGIPETARVILFIGRFMQVRGFDLLVEAAKLILQTGRQDVYFMAVGKKEDSPPQINSPQWIEVDHVSNPVDYMAMADACLGLGNFHFFDISMLEALSAGTPYIGTEASGHRYMKGRSEGFFCFTPGSVDSLAVTLLKFLKATPEDLKKMRKANRELYQKEFTSEQFAQRYLDMFETIYDDFGISASPDRKGIKNPLADKIRPTLME